MSSFKNLTGKRFGRLVVLERVENNKRQQAQWLCKCDCGNTKVICAASLKKGSTRSCGCLIHEINSTHSLRKTRLYNIWRGIKIRCFNQNSRAYKNYGGNGITMYNEWKDNFKSFYDWSMSNGYTDELSIDRIDNNKGYFPDNCRFVDKIVQANNKRNNRLLTYNGETHTVAEWGRILNISRSTLFSRLNMGWTVERMLTTQVKGKNK